MGTAGSRPGTNHALADKESSKAKPIFGGSRLLRIFWGDGPRVPQAKTERDVDFAWVPKQIEGDGREREKVANLRERETERESETLCIVVWAPSLSN